MKYLEELSKILPPWAVALIRKAFTAVTTDPAPSGTLKLAPDAGKTERQTKIELDAMADAQFNGRAYGVVKWCKANGAISSVTEPNTGQTVFTIAAQDCGDSTGRGASGPTFSVILPISSSQYDAVTGNTATGFVPGNGTTLAYCFDAQQRRIALTASIGGYPTPTAAPTYAPTTVSWAKVTGDVSASTTTPTIFTVSAVKASDEYATSTSGGSITVVLPVAPDAFDGFVPSTAASIFPQSGAVIPFIDDGNGSHIATESHTSGHALGLVRWAKAVGNITYSPTTPPGTAAGTVYSILCQACSGVSGNDAQGGNFSVIIPVDPSLYAVLVANNYTFFLPQNGRTVPYMFDVQGNRIASHGV